MRYELICDVKVSEKLNTSNLKQLTMASGVFVPCCVLCQCFVNFKSSNNYSSFFSNFPIKAFERGKYETTHRCGVQMPSEAGNEMYNETDPTDV